MSQQQLVEKITHLEAQLTRLESLEFNVRNTWAISNFLTRRINRYRQLSTGDQKTVFDNPISL